MTIVNSYAGLQDGRWLRGNLHTHTTASDGQRPLQEVVDDYAARGYDFLAITDHDVYSGPERYAACNPRGMTLLPGNEITRGGPHVLHVGADRRIEPSPLRQQVINQINATAGFAVINHPNSMANFNFCPLASMEAWIEYAGLEIYNGVISRLDGSPYATDKWDMLLSQGRRLWGFANDDSHLAAGDVALGWNMVYARDRSAEELLAALRAGRFYASTGVILRSIAVNDNRIRIETENARRIVALHQVGQRFATADAQALEVEVPAHARYVRFECWGEGERFAWTQPFFVT